MFKEQTIFANINKCAYISIHLTDVNTLKFQNYAHENPIILVLFSTKL